MICEKIEQDCELEKLFNDNNFMYRVMVYELLREVPKAKERAKLQKLLNEIEASSGVKTSIERFGLKDQVHIILRKEFGKEKAEAYLSNLFPVFSDLPITSEYRGIDYLELGSKLFKEAIQ